MIDGSEKRKCFACEQGRQRDFGWQAGGPPTGGLDLVDTAAWNDAIEAARRQGHITVHWMLVLLALPRLAGPFGLFPAQLTIAVRADVSLATVKRALAWARVEGFVRTTRRRITLPDGRERWSTCDYELALPDAPLAELPRPHQPFKQWQERRAIGRQLRLALRPPSKAQPDRRLFTDKDCSTWEPRKLWITEPHPPLRTVEEQLRMLREG
jgi:hypothetical protein